MRSRWIVNCLGRRRQPSRHGLVPVRRRWTASTVVATLVLSAVTVTIASAVSPTSAQALSVGSPNCSGNTIYALQANSVFPSSAVVWAINITTGASTQIGNTAAGPANALAVSKTAWYFEEGGATSPFTTSYVYYTTPAGPFFNQGPQLSHSGVETRSAAIDPLNGLMYYSDNVTGTLWAYNPATLTNIGKIGTFTGGTGTQGDIVFDAQGNGYYSTNNAVFRFDPPPTTAGTVSVPLTLLGTQTPNGIGGIAFGGDGLMYMVNTSAGTIYKLDPNSGALVGALTVTGGAANAQFDDLGSCINPGTISVKKNLPSGRVNPSDQFNLEVDGSSVTTGNTATTTGTATGVQAATAGPTLASPGQSYSIKETATNNDLSSYLTTWTCIDANNGNAVIGSGTGTAGTVTYPAALSSGRQLVCTFSNVPIVAPVLTLTKALGSNRAGSVDQFTVSIKNGATTVNSAAHSTTLGSGATVTAGSGTTGATTGVTGTTYVLGETAASGSLANYTSTIGCSDANGQQAGLPGAGTAFNPATGLSITPVNDSAISCTIVNTAKATITLAKTTVGGVGTFSFSGTNGVAATSLTTVTSGTPVASVPMTLTAVNTSTVITEAAVAGWAISATSACTGMGAGGAATVSTTARTITLNAAATAAGSNIVCTFVNQKLPTITITKISNGGVGTFGFTGNNGYTAQSITTTTAGVGTSAATEVLTGPATTTISEGTVAGGFTFVNASCTGLGAGGTQTPTANGVTLDAAATAYGSNIACTFTNSKRPTLTITKVSVGGTGSFSFTGTNGYPGQTIATITSGVGVTAPAVTLTTPGAATTITEAGPPAGYVLAVSCTGVPAGSFSLSGSVLSLTAAATAAGNNIACTFTNTLVANLSSSKVLTTVNGIAATPGQVVSAGDILKYTIAVTNSGGVPGSTVLTETTPAGTTHTNGTEGWTGTGPYTQTVTVPGGATVPVMFTVTVNTPPGVTSITNVVTSPSCTNPAACAPPPNPIGSYSVVKTISIGNLATATAGATLTYTLSIANTGKADYPSMTITDDATDVLDDATYVSGSSGVSRSGNTITWTGALGQANDAAHPIVATYVVRVGNPATGNGQLNNAIVGGPPGGNCPGAAGCVTSNPTSGYTIVKTDSAGDGVTVTAGSTLTYTLTITNTGAVALPSVTVTDDFTAVLDDAAFGSASGGATRSGNTVTWTGALPVSATPVVVTYTVIVSNPDTGNGTLTNAVVGVTPGGNCPGATGCVIANPVSARRGGGIWREYDRLDPTRLRRSRWPSPVPTSGCRWSSPAWCSAPV